ncbi:MAG: glycoside hydrolase family 2 TIM barrel-domain containing protein [Candidatus Kryptoniota bacterium]
MSFHQVSPTRERIDLSGTWHVSSAGSEELQDCYVPSVVNSRSQLKYSKAITIPSNIIKSRVFDIHVGNGGVWSEIRIDNEYVGTHSGAYSAFGLRIPDRLLQAGINNTIEITQDNHKTAYSTIPFRQLAFQPKCYSGLSREVYIDVKPPIYIESPQLRVTHNSDLTSFQVGVNFVVYASDYSRYGIDSSATTLNLTTYAEIYDRSSNALVGRSQGVAFSLEQNHNIRINLSVGVMNPKLWSPVQPDLYEVRIYVLNGQRLLDELIRDLGFRDFTVSGGEFYLNGKAIFIKSVDYVVDYPHVFAAMNDSLFERDIAIIKTIGANAIRVVGFPPPERLLELCDRFGLLVFEEMPVMDATEGSFANRNFVDALSGYEDEYIYNTAWHPSVAGISAGSFLGLGPNAISYINGFGEKVHRNTNLPFFYSIHAGANSPLAADADFFALDMSSFSSARGLRDFLSQIKNSYPEKCFLVSSVGVQCEMNNHNGYSDPNSMEYQARFLVDAYQSVEDNGLAGISINSFSDWNGEVPHLFQNGHPYLYSFGLVSYWREKRLSFNVVRALFNDETLPPISIGTYTETPPIIYVVLSTLLLVVITYLHYSRRWFRENVTRALLRPYNFFADVRDERILSLVQTFILALIISCGIAIYLSSILFAYKDNYFFDKILGLLLVNNLLKIKVDYLIYHPLNFIIAFTVVLIVLSALMAFIIKLFSYGRKLRFQLASAFMIETWSFLPFIGLILVDMFLFRLLGDRTVVLGASTLLVFFLLLSLFRMFQGIGVAFDIPTYRVAIIGIIVSGVILAAVIYYYNSTESLFAYLKAFYHLSKGIKNI